jgi:hypothetical protein
VVLILYPRKDVVRGRARDGMRLCDVPKRIAFANGYDNGLLARKRIMRNKGVPGIDAET